MSLKKTKITLCIFMLCLHTTAHAKQPITHYIPTAQLVGEGTLTFAFFDVYSAQLYAPSGTFAPDKPFAISLRYLRDIDGNDIAERSVEEIRRQGVVNGQSLTEWGAKMKTIFPNVQHGTVLSAVFYPGKKTVFFQGNKMIGAIEDAGFTRAFADIWLSQKTSEPELRKELLNIQ